ncbi:S8 family serine peptidase [Pseudogracilibacillus auburnensis]|uniref:S8 family serine peptidase n=1 Tax=Pseudogracilibacillus auburnensis TaxID=1494959 RepID=UPI001A971710|nr:S8 family serine peptidase [Pseudogracilibacillus auburnensis]MBO1005948.1 S8 family serine peptidase [Pseudogracilibacillus auburnensis]
MLRRSALLLLIFLLAFGNLASAFGEAKPGNFKKKPPKITEKVKETEDPNKEQRVIIELEKEAPIELATKKGVSFKKLAKTQKKQLEKEIKAHQKAVKEKIKDKKVNAKYLKDFTAVINGFSAEVKQMDIEVIKKMPEVKSVHIVNEYERPVIQPEMKYSHELVQAQEAWRDYGYKGEGMVVGIIDTGLDPSHRDMILTNSSTAALDANSVNLTITDEGLPGKFYTEKIPYGYNYMDENHNILDDYAGASMHGMHVGGTVGANGDVDNGGIKGIAPESQLLALKVFGNDPEMQSTYGDIYVKAMDDAIKLGVDVLNLSLGSPSSFVDPTSPEQEAVKRAVENGVLVSISAGNSALFADGYYYPLASNPDYGVSGAPGISYESLQVASFENSHMEVDGLSYSINGENGTAPFLSAGNTDPSTDSTFDLVEAGLGQPGDFAGKDVNGKYALVQRGGIAFTEKALNAQAAGAAGVIIYNNTDGIVNMATDDAIEIPQLFMLKNDGDKLAAALKDGLTVTITFTGEKATIDNPDAGNMSDFSSWGLTPNLDFKPEITAPGGQILSTLNDNKYGLMSGTSMAAPHVSGGGALVLERVDQEFKYDSSDRVLLAKNLMMNTAKLVDFDGAKVSPRRQGSGMMQLHSALSTPVVVTETKTNEAKVALKQITSNKVTFELTAENFSDKAVTYDVKANAQTDQFVQNGPDLLVAPNLFGALDLDGMAVPKINGEDVSSVEVPANGKAKIEVSIDVSGIDAALKSRFTNGYWLEGFVTLTDPTDTNPQISVPYVGFKGEWDQAPIFDKPMWDAETYYGMTGVVTSLGKDNYEFLGEDFNTGAIDPSKIAFSPNGNGTQDDAILILSLLRNAKEAKFNVLDANGKVIRTLITESEVRKNYYDGGRAPMYSLSPTRAWDGKIGGKVAPEGQYYLQAEAVIDYPDAKWQSISIPIILDVTAPELEATFDAEVQKVSVQISDDGSGVAYWDVLVDGKSVLDKPYTAGETEHQLTKRLSPEQTLTVVAVDYAGNKTEAAASEGKDTTAPDLHLLTPEFLGVESSRKVEFSGYVKDKSGVKSVTVDGKEAKLTYNAEKDQYDFSITLNHKKDGYYFYHIKATDNVGNETEIGRRFFIDTEKAKIKVKAKNNVETDTIIVSADITDNFDQIRLYVNDSEVYKHELSEPYGMKNFKQTVEGIELQLEDGDNEFIFKVVDLGGNVTTEKVKIKKKAKKEKK